MKQGPVSKSDAFETFDNTMVCGIVNGGGGGTVTVNPTVPSVSNGIYLKRVLMYKLNIFLRCIPRLSI
jgi:hypothetical protein